MAAGWRAGARRGLVPGRVVALVVVLAACGGGPLPVLAVDPTPAPAPTRTSSAPPAPALTTSAPPAPTVATTVPRPATVPPGLTGVVTRHVDGDTLRVDGVPVRLIGIDAPETVRPGSPVGCFGPEASAALARLLPVGTRVRLVPDVSAQDRYGRRLAYVYRAGDGLFVNLELVRTGFATVYTVPPDVARAPDLLAAERAARAASAGLWGGCPAGPAGGAPPPGGAGPPGGSAAPYYRNCAAARAAGVAPIFRGQPGYRSGLDRDGDGVACE